MREVQLLDGIALERHRAQWVAVAKAHGWYSEPFFIQAWVMPDGRIEDSVAHKAMSVRGADIIIRIIENPF